ncbi:TPA: YIP1 family protein [Candidatus Avigastranaerophilus faecigallinarum]|nr:YIP1 family protein [Candidatus Avigastranaerophilus faecigallinarum]
MGITVNDFFENIYSVIFSPKAFFEREDITISVRLALVTVIFIALINKITLGIFDGSILNMMFILSLLGSIISTVFLWFLTALFFEYIARIFDRGKKLEKILFLTAFVPIPYIFFAPLNLLKQIGEIGYIFATLIEFVLYFWIIFLYALALRAAYNITISRAFMLIFLPFVASVFAINWMVCFVSKLWYIFSI